MTSLDTTLGFYTVQFDEVTGWIGGYLLLNGNGRPLEFHCTLPLQTTRTQEMLYGQALEPFLVGDLIGRALIDKARLEAAVVVTDRIEARELAQWIKSPVACISEEPADIDCEIHVEGIRMVTSQAGQAIVADVMQRLPATLDLREPLDRVREALGEAKATTRAAA